MSAVEVKFMFEGVIFSSRVIVSSITDSLNRLEFTISFFSRYLISKYASGYFLVLENDKFKPVYTKDEKETELIKCIQDALLKIPGLSKERFAF
jgi:hypothetical protein